jgi:hypothetical protein
MFDRTAVIFLRGIHSRPVKKQTRTKKKVINMELITIWLSGDLEFSGLKPEVAVS